MREILAFVTIAFVSAVIFGSYLGRQSTERVDDGRHDINAVDKHLQRIHAEQAKLAELKRESNQALQQARAEIEAQVAETDRRIAEYENAVIDALDCLSKYHEVDHPAVVRATERATAARDRLYAVKIMSEKQKARLMDIYQAMKSVEQW